MKFELRALPLPGNTIHQIYTFLVDGVEHIAQISKIGAYDIAYKLRDMHKGNLVDEALRQLGMAPPVAEQQEPDAKIANPTVRTSRGPGRPSTNTYNHFREELPDRIPAEEVADMGAVPE